MGINRFKLLGTALLALSLLAILIPHVIFPVSEYQGIRATVILPPTMRGFVMQGGVATMPYRDYWMAWAEVAVSVPLAITSLMLIFAKRAETRRSLALVAMVLGIMVLLLPTALIGTPQDPSIPSNTTTKPALIAVGGLIIGLAIAVYMASRGEELLPISELLNSVSFVKRDVGMRKIHSALTMACIAIAIGSLFSSAVLMDSVNRSIEIQMNRLGADIIVVPKGYKGVFEKVFQTGYLDKPFCFDRSIEEQLKKIPQVEAVTPQLYMVTLTEASCCAVWSVLLVGFDPETDFVVTPWLATPLDGPLGKDDAIQGCLMLLPIGGETMFYGSKFRIVGQLEPTGTGFDQSFFMTLEGAYEMAKESKYKAEKPLEIKEGEVSAFFLRVKPGRYSISDIAIHIKMRISGVDVITSTNIFQTVRNQVSRVLQMLLFSGEILWGMATILMAVVFSMMVNERRREIGLLRAMGATRKYVSKLLIFEAVLLALLGGILGIIGGGIVVFFFNTLIVPGLNFPYVPPTPSTLTFIMLSLLGLAAATGVIAALYPALNLSKVDPYELIRKGEI